MGFRIIPFLCKDNIFWFKHHVLSNTFTVSAPPLFEQLTLLSVADVLFGMKCYYLHEEYLASLKK